MKKPIFENEQEAVVFFLDILPPIGKDAASNHEKFTNQAIENMKERGYIKKDLYDLIDDWAEERNELFKIPICSDDMEYMTKKIKLAYKIIHTASYIMEEMKRKDK